MKHIDIALNVLNKSDLQMHSHGAVCVIGGKVASTGFNSSTVPFCFKDTRKDDFLQD